MSAGNLGSLAINILGGGGTAVQAGIVTGITTALTADLLAMMRLAIRKVLGWIQSAIKAVLAERERLGVLDPVAALALLTTNIRTLVREIGRARILGPSLLNLSIAMENLKDAFEPLRRVISEEIIVTLTSLVNIMNKDVIPGLADFAERLVGSGRAQTAMGFFPGGVGILFRLVVKALDKIADENKKTREENEADKALEGINTIVMNDLRSLTEDAVSSTLSGREIIRRRPTGPGTRDLFTPPGSSF